MRAARRHPIRLGILTGLALCVLLGGCGAATTPSPDPALPDEVAASSVGDRATLTAVVETVLSDYILVLAGADDPRQRLLVVSAVRTDLHTGDLVVASGQVLRFHYAEFSGPYWLTDRAPFRSYENHKFLLASELRSAA